ncbi:macro domain-containing protein, partial [Mesorhizobium sp. M2A.F.Ca.ET.039.01.1.1]|uniref:macro domain-containing protein n=1 Tax=Mesorhizobium sp. M2A.F.Ca.ET.039.01.1.1 TaxID=2496746 RepID=UPI000FF1D00B
AGASLLASCYRRSLEIALGHDCRTVAFPAISTGIYRFPKEEATGIAVDTVSNFLRQNAVPDAVTFCCFDEQTAEIYRRAAAAVGRSGP